MKRPKWSTVTIALALIAALTIASPVFGVSIRKLVKNEVAKQISKAQGPAGTPGTPGTPGSPGAAGTARAYARVTPHASDSCAPGCTFDHSKGVTSVTRNGTGDYCVFAPGIDAASVPAVVSIDYEHVGDPEGNASALVDLGGCPSGGFRIVTERQPVTAVDKAGDAGDTMNTNVAGNATESDDIGFMIVIP